MAYVFKTSPSFQAIEPIGILSNSSRGTLRTLDLRQKIGATFLVWIGRTAATTPTRSGYVSIRNTDSNANVFPAQTFDIVGQGPTTAAASTTLTAGASAGTDSLSLTSATGFAVGDTICISVAGGARLQFARIVNLSGTTVTLERNLRVTANTGDSVSNLADARRIYVPGGDIYEIRTVNYSGLDLVFQVDAIVDEGEIIS